MGVGMARNAQNVPKLANRQYLWSGMSYCVDFFFISYVSMRTANWSSYFRWAWPWVWPGMQQGSNSIKLQIFLDFFTTGSVKVDHFNLSVSPSFSPSVDFSFYYGDPLILYFLSNWLQIPCLLKFWLLRYKPKYFRPFTLQDS